MSFDGYVKIPANIDFFKLEKQLEAFPQVQLIDCIEKCRPMPRSKKICYLNKKYTALESGKSNFHLNNCKSIDNTLFRKDLVLSNETENKITKSSDNIIKCKVTVNGSSLKSSSLPKKAENKVLTSKYLFYLKKSNKEKTVNENLSPMEVNEPTKKITPTKRGSDDLNNSFASCEIEEENPTKKSKMLTSPQEENFNDSAQKSVSQAETSTFGLPYEPVGEKQVVNFEKNLSLSSTSSCSSPFHRSESNFSNLSFNTDDADVVVELDFDENSGNILKGKNYELVNEPGLSLQDMAEKLMSKSRKEIVEKLKLGLCKNWAKNNFFCTRERYGCHYVHNARELFKKKLKKIPTNFIISIIIEMRRDVFFVDALIEGFEILKKRAKSERLLPFLCFFAFYVSDTKDLKFLGFWAEAAAYFRMLEQSEDTTDGFVYLLKIFRQIDRSRQGKIIEFLEVLKNPFFNLKIDWKLLEPVHILKMPSSLLLKAVESCNQTKVYVDEVYGEIVSRILVSTLPIHGVETLLQFVETLKATDRYEKAGNLKRRLLSRVETLEKPIPKIFTQTYACYCELEPRDSMLEEENEDQKVDEILKNDEEKVQNRAFSPPPPNCYLNPSFFIQHSELPSKFDGRPRPPMSLLKRSRRKNTPRSECLPRRPTINKILINIKNNDFSKAGDYLNYLPVFQKEEVAEVTEEIVKSILQMKVSSDEFLNFLEQVIFNCHSRNSAIVISSISNTMIAHFVDKINDWKTAYSILHLCSEKEIDLSKGLVLTADEYSLSQFRIVLLLLECCINNDKFEEAYNFIERFNLFSKNHSLETHESDNDSIRVKVLQDFIEEIVKIKSPYFFKTITKIWEAQGDLKGEIDLSEYSNIIGHKH